MTKAFSLTRSISMILALELTALPMARGARAEDFYAEVRSLQRVQDQVAQGNPAAQSSRISLVRAIAKTHADSLGIDHLSGRDRTAVLQYILGGGDPGVGMVLSEVGALGGDEALIFQGARAFAAGDKVTALDRLAHVRPERLPPALGGQVALVRASVRPAEDVEATLRDLVLAETLAPGTLVEEAALRRRANVARKGRNFGILMQVARRYFRVFPHSFYAGHFMGLLVEAMAEFDYEQDESRIVAVGQFLNSQPEALRGPLAVSLARAGLDHGSQRLTHYAAGVALALVTVQGSLRIQATLYEASMGVLGEPPVRAAAMATLERLEDHALDARDRAVKRDALKLGATLNLAQKPQAAEALPVVPRPAPDPVVPIPAPDSVAETVKQASAVQSSMVEALRESTP